MSFIDRFEIALGTPLGIIFLTLLAVFLLLLALYLILTLVQKKRPGLTDTAIKDFTFLGNQKNEFWGRQSTVKFTSGELASCLITVPKMFAGKAVDDFHAFRQASDNLKITLFAPYIWEKNAKELILVQGGLVRKDGRPLLNLKHHYSDNMLSLSDKENILLEIAHGVAKLHEAPVETGEPLYHGFLLPRSIFIDFNAGNTLNKIVIADNGLAYACGPQKLFARLNELRAGKLSIDKYASLEILDQLPMLAPEQKNQSGLSSVGQASDLYSYAALAVVLFTRKRFVDGKDVAWEMIPQAWRGFLKDSLEENPANRPENFGILEDALHKHKLVLAMQSTSINGAEI